MTTTYAKRENVFEKGEHVWRAEAETLVWTRPAGDSLTVLWADVTSIRAAFAPTKWKAWRHLIEIDTRQGQRLTIDNAHFKGVGDFEDRSASFTPFALACVARIAEAAPEAGGWLGASRGAYVGQLAFVFGMLALLIFVLVALPTSLGVVVIAKLVLIVVSLPTAIAWAIKARPRRAAVTPEAFAAALPRA
jgi:hypothetical protein